MTPVLIITMLVVARSCFDFQNTFQRVHHRKICTKGVSNGSVFIAASVVGLFALFLIISLNCC